MPSLGQCRVLPLPPHGLVGDELAPPAGRHALSSEHAFKPASPAQKRAFRRTSPSVLSPSKQAQVPAWWESPLPLGSRDAQEKWDPVIPSEVPQAPAARSGGAFLSSLPYFGCQPQNESFPAPLLLTCHS